MNELGSGSRYLNHFHCSRSSTGQNSAAKPVGIYAQSAPKLADWLEDNIPESLTMFSFMMENLNRVSSVNSLAWVCLENQHHPELKASSLFGLQV